MKRGRPFDPGNKFGRGRPPGSRNKRTVAAHNLLDRYSEPLMLKAVTMALQGDKSMLQLLLKLIPSRAKDQPVKLGSLRIRTAEDLNQASQILLNKVAAGALTPGDGQVINELLECRRHIIETTEFTARLSAIEQLFKRNSDAREPWADSQ